MTREEFIAKFKVGDWVSIPISPVKYEVVAIGDEKFFARTKEGRETALNIKQVGGPWLPAERQPVDKCPTCGSAYPGLGEKLGVSVKRVAPAVVRSLTRTGLILSAHLFESEEQARREYPGTFISWPAGNMIEIREDTP